MGVVTEMSKPQGCENLEIRNIKIIKFPNCAFIKKKKKRNMIHKMRKKEK